MAPMANLTLSIDDDLLHRARQAALRENTTVNALVRENLGSYVDARSSRLAALDAFEAIAATTSRRSSAPWCRELLHEP